MDKTLSQSNALYELSRRRPAWINRPERTAFKNKHATIAGAVALGLAVAVLAGAAVALRHAW